MTALVRSFPCLLAGLLAGAPASQALTIYRIGGEDVDLPDIDGLEVVRLSWDELPAPASDAPVTFVQLPWAGAVEDAHGSTSLLQIGANSIVPQRLDPDVNLTPLIRSRGGSIESTEGYAFKDTEEALKDLFDENPKTAYSGGGSHFTFSDKLAGGNRGPVRVIVFNLGGAFPLSRIRLYPTPKYADQRIMKEFTIGINDARLTLNDDYGDPHGFESLEMHRIYSVYGFTIHYNVALSAEENTVSTIEVDLDGTPVWNIIFDAPVGNWEIAEFEIYGDGFAGHATYRSNIIDLGRSAALGDLVWSGERDPDAEVKLTMRSGSTPDPNDYWRNTFRGDERVRFDVNGKVLTRKAYARLEGGERGGITPNVHNWQAWNSPFDFGSQEAEVPADRPRRFAQFNVEFATPAAARSGSRLDYLQFDVSSPPVASQVVAEIDPPVVEAGTLTRFRYLLLAALEDTLSFDSIEIETPIEVASVDSIFIDGVYLDRSQWELERNSTGFVVTIPTMDVHRTNDLVEVVFQTEVFEFGTEFKGRIFNSSRPDEVRQRVRPGDADELVDSNTLNVALVELAASSIQGLDLSTSVVTPNGDGVNDELEIRFDVVNLSGSVPVTLTLYDLAGSKVTEAFAGVVASGRHPATWDGTGADGQPVLPGVYILRLNVDADEGDDAILHVVSVAY